MSTVTWDDAFELAPADTDEAKYGALKIRQLKTAISERLELEMNFKTGTQPLLKAGKAAVIFSGTTTEVNALTGMSAGALAWDTTLSTKKRYNGASWDILSTDHGTLAGLTDDDHTQYLNLTKESQTLTQNLSVATGKTIDGRDVSADGVVLDSLAAGASPMKFVTPVNLLTWTAATNWTDVNISALTGTDTAKAALLAAELLIEKSGGSAEEFKMTGLCRKNGSSETSVLPRIIARTYHGNYDSSCYTGNATMLIVECDTSELFEVKLQADTGTPSTISFKVDLIGYFV